MSRLVTVADRNMPGVEQAFGELGDVRRLEGRELGREDLLQADILLVRSVTRVNRELLRGTPVRFVGTATSGFDHVDRAFLSEAGIGFCHAPGSNANSVVEYVLAAIAACGDKLEQLLAGGSVGVVGYGHVGSALVARLGRLGIASRVYDPWLAAETVPGSASLEAVLACEVICLHPELTRRIPFPSFHLLGTEQLARLGENQLLINVSRGAVIDNSALRERLAAAAAPDTVLDVWEGEPALDPELLTLVKLGSAHIAGYSLDGKLRATSMLRSALAVYLGEEPPRERPLLVAPVLEIPAGLEGAALLRWLLSARYDVRRDDRLLRQATLQHPAEDAALAFDQLRRHYPERRELSGSQVLAPGASTQTRAWLDALGCEYLERQ